MTPEQALDKQIMLFCGEHNWLCFHCNVGKVKMEDGRYFDTGLPPGFPDLLIITDNNTIIFCETKIKPRKPSENQKKFINNLLNRGFIAFVSYNFDEFQQQIHDFYYNKIKPPFL